MLKTLRAVVLPILIGFAILAVVGLLGSGLVLYREARAVHPLLGALVLIAVAAGIVLLVLVPIAQVLRLPGALTRPSEQSGPKWDRFVRRYAKRLARNSLVRAGHAEINALDTALREKGDAALLEVESAKAVTYLDGEARKIVARHAAAVFTATAISQSGRLDAAIVLSAQLRLVKEIAELYYQRPRPRELWAVYVNVGASVFVAGEIQDSELLAVLGAPVTAGLTGLLPVHGTDPLVSLLVTSLLDGSANAFLTLRVGALARRYCGLRLEGDRREVTRSASLEAAGLLGTVVGDGAKRVASLTRRAVSEGAVRGTKGVARSVAGWGSSLFEKVASVAQKVGAKAVESASSGARYLEDSALFWDSVSEATEAGPVDRNH
jgi:hypothetical protein